MSESKKVVSCDFTKEFDSKYGKLYNFSVKFEGDDKTYQYSAKDKDNPFFKVGEVKEFDVEEKKGTNADGSEWTIYKLKPVKPAFNPMGGGKSYAKKGKQEYSCEALQFTASYVKDLIISGQVELKDWTSKVDEIMKYNEKKIAEYLKPE